jgi:rhodanese-related sulfurtransferase
MSGIMSRMLRCLAIALVGVFVISASALAAENWPDSLNDYVAQVRKGIQTTDMKGFLAVLKNPNGALLLDVREADEFKAGHIPGTINIPRGVLEYRIYKQLGYPKTVDTNQKIYVNCATGGRCTLAAKGLKDIGFTNVTAVLINLQDWEKAGNPWEK